MYLKILDTPENYRNKAEIFFSACFCKNLKTLKPGTYIESLVARYFIETYRIKLQKTKDLCSNFSSISHKKDLVFVGLSTENIGVDIEVIKKRDAHLLEKFNNIEYNVLGKRDWNNFYLLWTAKETIIKYENLLLDDMEKIILTNVEVFRGNISGIQFQNKLILNYRDKKFTVYCGQEKNTVFSVCVSSKLG